MRGKLAMHESNEVDLRMTRAEVRRQLNHLTPKTTPDQTIDDADFLELRNALESHADFHEWKRRPRLYRLLRMLGLDQDHPIFNSFVEEQLYDVSLPFRERYLPMALRDEEDLMDKFLNLQLLVCSKTELMNAFNFTSHMQVHRYISDGKAHFEELENLGKGGSASVERVRHKLSGICFARKAIWRGNNVEHQRQKLGEFQREMDTLKRLRHKHLISYVGSYTDLNYFALILSPVAEMELKTLLYRQNDKPLEHEEIGWLRNAFGCIANAVAYCHEQKVRHKDVKPGNILLNNGQIFLCDFGIAHDWSEFDHATTTGEPGKHTRRYSAPEVVDSKARNQSSDIWSMGCVFLEMLSVIKGHTMQELENFLVPDGAVEYWRLRDAVADWVQQLRDDTPEDVALEWIEKMMNEDPALRPTAAEVLQDIQVQYHSTASRVWFIGNCCVSQSQSSIASPTTSRSDSSVGPTDVSHLRHDIVPPHHTTTSFRSPFPERPSSTEFRTDSPRSDLARQQSLQVPPSGRRRSPTPSSSASNRPSFAVSEPARGNGSESTGDRQGSLPVRLHSDLDTPPLSTPISFPGLAFSTQNPSGTPQSGLGISAESPVVDFTGLSLPVEFTGSSLHCLCGPRHDERQIFEAPLASSCSHRGIDLAERNEQCQGGFRAVRVYERKSKEVWETTRRIVFSMQENNANFVCVSFWLPLANIHTQIHTDTISLWWSDCNHIKRRPMGNWADVYDWVYDPHRPNYHVTLQIPVAELENLEECLRLPLNDTDKLRRERIHRIQTSSDQVADLYSVCGKSPRTGNLERLYRMLVLLDTTDQVTYSTIYSMGPDLDFEMKLLDDEIQRRYRQRAYRFQVKIKNISSPMYISDLNEMPAPDPKKKAKCQSIKEVESNAILNFTIGATHDFPSPPEDVVNLLGGLTAWSLTFFGVVSRFRSPRKRIGTKDYGSGDLMLWERNNSDRTGRVCQLAFRVYPSADRDPASEKLWTTGTVKRDSNISTTHRFDATIEINNKTNGHLLDIRNMTASDPGMKTSETVHHRVLHAKNDTSDIIITFDDPKCQREFYNLIKLFQETAATNSSEIRRSAASSSPRHGRLSSVKSFGSDLSPTIEKLSFSPKLRSPPRE